VLIREWTDMARETSKGKCVYCNREFSKPSMTNHLKACKQRIASIEAVNSGAKKSGTTRIFHLVVEGQYLPMYWMHLEVPAWVTLAGLDQFLRNIWVECCGHLSAFKIGNVTYHSDAQLTAEGDMDDLFSQRSNGISDEIQAQILQSLPPERQDAFKQWIQSLATEQSLSRPLRRISNMEVESGQVLQPGLKFTYEYDFGSTTELALKVIAEREGKIQGRKNAIQIMARNELPVVPCDICGEKPATLIYQGWDDPDSWLCKDCARATQDLGMMLPIVNSPRTGVCGYTG
jgi:hypothetical protein